jgi:voltage-gated potassium channel
VATVAVDLGPRDPDRAEMLARRLDRPMAGLGLVFVLVVLGQVLAREPGAVAALGIASWVLWCIFVGELLLRAYVARDQRAFWSRNWWQLVFLAVPFLRFARVLAAWRAARVAAVVGAAVRGTRSAGRVLSSRVWWLSIVTVIVALSSSQLLFALGSYDDYGTALHAAALATIAGEPLAADDGFARVMELVLAAYSVVIFATIAAAVGAYFLGSDGRQAPDGRGRGSGAGHDDP